MLAPETANDDETQAGLRELSRWLARGEVMVLTGAGVSTDSGIPAYRDESGAWKGRAPIQFREFVGSEGARKRYWARSLRGFQWLASAAPNAAHRALAELEQRGCLSLLVTQNVDGLHRVAGSKALVELHGRIDQVVCLGCGAITERAALQSELLSRNGSFAEAVAHIKPDGDAELESMDYDQFQVVPCAQCQGMLKPNVVFFGENVPAPRVLQAMTALEQSRRLLVIGSSLTVFSGYRFARAAARHGIPIALLNQGKTRADELATLALNGNAGTLLSALVA